MPAKTSKHLTPEIKAKIATLKSAGYSYSAITEKTGASLSSVKRHGKFVPKGGLSTTMLEDAQKELVASLTDDAIKRELAASLQDELALSRRIRANVMSGLESIESSSPKTPHEVSQTMRALMAASGALKLTSDVLNKSMGVTARNLHADASHDDLPELPIVNLTEAELTGIRGRAESLSLGTSDGLGGLLSDTTTEEGIKNENPDENPIVIEGDFETLEGAASKESKVV